MEQVEDKDEESSMCVIWSWVGWERSTVQEKERK